MPPPQTGTPCTALLVACALTYHGRVTGAEPAEGACPIDCSGTNASGHGSTSLGFNTTASGEYSFAAGNGCVASGLEAVAFGHMTNAGPHSIAMGYKTVATHNGAAFGYMTSATGLYSAAFGNYVGTTERESLIVSGKVHASNIHIFAEDRLAANVTALPARDRAAMLSQLRALELTEWSPSPKLCAHRGVSAHRCAAPELRSVGLLASRVEAAMPAAVKTTSTTLHLTEQAAAGRQSSSSSSSEPAPAPAPASESLENLRSLDVAALLTRLVGSVQALDAQVQSQQAELSELRAEVATQKHTIAALRGQR